MSLKELYNLLTSITGFTAKVCYRAFPEGAAPALPYIVYYVEQSDNFMADGKVYLQKNEVTIELYSQDKDVTSESALEAVLDANCIPWNKYEDYIDSEHMYMISYDITI